MRFALLGTHPDGVQMARALVESGRQQLLVYTNPVPDAIPGAWCQDARRVNDLEEILADPAIEAIIVASQPGGRPVHLRRALQSERHVLCVYPPDQTPEIAYEAALIQKDTGFVLFPLLPAPLHPAIERLADLGQSSGPLGTFQLLELEWCETGHVLRNAEAAGHKLSFPAWDVLRRLGGEIAEVTGFAWGEEVPAEEPVLLSGRFEKGGLFQLMLLPRRPAPFCRLRLVGARGQAELTCDVGWYGPSQLTWSVENHPATTEAWPAWNPWPTLVERFEDAFRTNKGLAWQDAVRMLELDDAARRSIEKRRSSLLEYPEASEEVGFKGAMTLFGCGMLWLVIVMLILSRWWPRIYLVAVPLLLFFLLLQLLRYVLPSKPDRPS